MKISIIGAGKMGTAMAEQLSTDFEVQLCERGEEPTGEVVIFAVKPQDFVSCVEGLAVDLSGRLVISIMAGISLENLAMHTGSNRVIRSLPNLPLQIGMGLTEWVTSAACNKEDKALTRKIFKSFGSEVELSEENKIDEIAMVSGCGPAFFFYLCELLEEQAKQFGFDAAEARTIAEQTFYGAASLMRDSKDDRSAAEWRQAVSSKGGITLAALEKMQAEGFPQALDAGIQAGIKRSHELNS